MIAALAAAFGFLTRLPIGRRWEFTAKDVGRGAMWFPLVGAVLGGIGVGALWLSTRVFPSPVSAVILVALDALLTGGMHFDGLADTADGFGGGRTREDVLRIMRDHAVGSYGAIALILAVALKAAAIAALIDRGRAVSAVLLAPVLGRWAAVLLSATQTYVRQDDGTGSPTRHVGRRELVWASIVAVGFAGGFAHWIGAAACALAAAGSAWWAWRCRRKIGGVTGDTLGAAVELSECLVLLLFVGVR